MSSSLQRLIHSCFTALVTKAVLHSREGDLFRDPLPQNQPPRNSRVLFSNVDLLAKAALRRRSSFEVHAHDACDPCEPLARSPFESSVLTRSFRTPRSPTPGRSTTTRSFRTPHPQTLFTARDATPLARPAAGHEPLFRGPCRAHESLSELMFARETASSFEASGSSNTTIARRVSCARERLSTLTHVLLSRVIHDAFAFHETLRSHVRTSFSACSPSLTSAAPRATSLTANSLRAHCCRSLRSSSFWVEGVDCARSSSTYFHRDSLAFSSPNPPPCPSF